MLSGTEPSFILLPCSLKVKVASRIFADLGRPITRILCFCVVCCSDLLVNIESRFMLPIQILKHSPRSGSLINMSRPDDGHHTFLPFGNPFKIFYRRSHLSPKLLALLNDFELMLATSLTNLKPKDLSEIFSLCWMRRAVESLSGIHTSIKNLITDLQFPIAEWDEKWVDVYLNDSVKLLDICLALSSEFSRLDQGQLLLRYLLQVLELSRNSPTMEQLKRAEARLHNWMVQFNSRCPKLETCHDILQNLAVTPYSEKVKYSDKGKVLMRALYGVKVETVIVWSIIMSTLSGSSKSLIELHVPDKFLWSKALNELQAIFYPEIRSHLSCGKATFLKELEAVEICVGRFHDVIGCVCNREEKMPPESNVCSGGVVPLGGSSGDERIEGQVMSLEKLICQEGIDILQEYVSDLAERSAKFTEELDIISNQVDGFFQIVLTGRDALLSNLRAPYQSSESNKEESMH